MNRKPPNIFENPQFDDYKNNFVQPFPRYTVKSINGDKWYSKNEPLYDTHVKAHLNGKYYIGTLGRWYPGYSIFDFDNYPIELVNDIRTELGLSDSNSILLTSESKDSYHLLFRPEFNQKPPTLKLLKNILKPFSLIHGIEIYPQQDRTIRLPFGKGQFSLDMNYCNLEKWEDYLYWFNKLYSFDLSTVEYQQLSFDLTSDSSQIIPNIIEDAKYLIDNGLQGNSTRYDSQFKILYYLWRNNAIQEHAENFVWNWINKKHNEFSNDINKYPNHVLQEIKRQASHIYNKYELGNVYPDSTHNIHLGYITEPDIVEIIKICHANLPQMKFTFNLVKYCYPRRYRTFLNIHTDRYIEWSSEGTYLKYLNELENKGIVKRGKAYLPGEFAKDLKINWKFISEDNAILYEGRAINKFEDTIKILFNPSEVREILLNAGGYKSTISMMLKNIYKN
ncbi:hypothetical protein ACFL50_03045 [Candidatus Latescibacterota bacterium]